MKTICSALAAGLLLLCCVSPSAAQQPLQGNASQAPTQNVTISLVANTTAIEPGKPFKVGADFKIADGWHIYYREPGDTGMPTNVDVKVPAGFKVVNVEWEQPTRFEENGFTTFGYTGKTTIAITVLPPDDLKPGDTINFTAKITWLACKDSCIPGSTNSDITLTVASPTSAASPVNQDKFANVGFTGDVKNLGKSTSVLDQDLKPVGADSDQYGFLTYLFFAFIGGIILNAMPCVLPVISFKILGFVKEAGESRGTMVRLGLSYAAGTIATCVSLALFVILAKFLGYSIGWGFQFQEPLFVVAMATLLTVMSIGLFGVFFMQVGTGEGLDKLSKRKGLAGAFFTGVVATILSTPCTAPFLGTAIGFAFAQPWWVVLTIFFMVGLGLATPYVLLCVNPGWMKLLPKPGVWMENFKESMGFILLGSVVWLLYVLGRQVGPDGVAGTVAFLLAASFGTWLYNKLGGLEATRRRKAVLLAVALAIAGATMYFVTWPSVKGGNWTSANTPSAPGAVTWEPFTKDAVDKHLKDGKVVFIDFTASWCQTCKVNEATVLASTAVTDAFKAKGVVTMQADWTLSNPEITQLLAKFGRAGVPLYVVLSPHRPTQPIVLPTILSNQAVIKAIEDASRP